MIITILHTESSTGWGGQEIRILRESLGMIKRGYKVIIATPESGKLYKRSIAAGIKTLPFKFQKKNPFSYIKMRSLLTQNKPDIINTHSSSDSWVASCTAKLLCKDIKVVRTRHISVPISRFILNKILYTHMTDMIMTTGEMIKNTMVEHNEFPAHKIVSVPTGVDLDEFDPKKYQQRDFQRKFTIGMVGVLRSWKGHEYFLKAAALLKDKLNNALFLIVGDGPQKENIKNLISQFELEKHVAMLGHRDDIPNLLSTIDILVHPSYSSEGIPQTLLQALSMRRPVIASDAGAINEIIINEQTGLLIHAKKPALLSDAILRLHNNPDLRNFLGKNGRQLVISNYSFDSMLDKIEKLYKKLLNTY
ncbi:MAG: glycosyltransferase family 4 protein [Nitrospirae bacterium]|nr:glycosyltransferase family 4 protein [Nitrospirota bacterium]